MVVLGVPVVAVVEGLVVVGALVGVVAVAVVVVGVVVVGVGTGASGPPGAVAAPASSRPYP